MRKFFIRFLPFLLPSIYVVLAVCCLHFPGIQYDEIFFGNAAQGGTVDNTFIVKRIKGIPVLMLEYIGALKAYLYFPIFKLFGVSVESIRLPVIILSAVSLWILFILVSRMMNRKSAIFTVFFIGFNPNFVALTRTDFGPVVLSFFFRVLSLLLFFFFYTTKKKRYMFALLPVLLLGLFNKADFIWFIGGFVIACLTLFGKEINRYFINPIPRTSKIILVSVLLVFGGLFFFVALQYGFFSSIDLFYWSHFIKIHLGIIGLFNGTLFFNSIYVPQSSVFFPLFSVFLTACVVIGTIWEIFLDKKRNKWFTFLTIVTLLIYFQLIITSKAGAPWHLIYLFPTFGILCAQILSRLYRHSKAGMFISLGFFMYVIITYATMHYQFLTHYGTTTKSVHWSSAIYELINYTKKRNLRFVSVDWGTHNQLLNFDYKKSKYYDEWPKFLPDPMMSADRDFLINNHYRNQSTVFILHPATRTEFKQTRMNFFKLAAERNQSTQLIGVVRDQSDIAYELYRLNMGK